jgi:hypothetical protein
LGVTATFVEPGNVTREPIRNASGLWRNLHQLDWYRRVLG